MMLVEIQEGKNFTRALKDTQSLVGTVTCVLRGVNVMDTFTSTEDQRMENNEDIGSSLPQL